MLFGSVFFFFPKHQMQFLPQEVVIAMRGPRGARGPVAMTETRGELLHLPSGFPAHGLLEHVAGGCLERFSVLWRFEYGHFFFDINP